MFIYRNAKGVHGQRKVGNPGLAQRAALMGLTSFCKGKNAHFKPKAPNLTLHVRHKTSQFPCQLLCNVSTECIHSVVATTRYARRWMRYAPRTGCALL